MKAILYVSKKLPIITPPKLQGVTDQIDALDHKLAVIRVRMILHLMYITLLFLICNPLYFLKIFPNESLVMTLLIFPCFPVSILSCHGYT